MSNSPTALLGSFTLSREEWIVVGVVLLGWLAFEMGPRLLNAIKKRRE